MYKRQLFISFLTFTIALSTADAQFSSGKPILNEGMLEPFGNTDCMIEELSRISELELSDLDGDGDLDLLIGTFELSIFLWIEYDQDSFSKLHCLDANTSEISSIKGADIDGDGDNDIILAGQGGTVLGWLENEDGLGTFGEEQIISESNSLNIRDLFVSDMDMDGDMDLLIAAGNTIGWYENLDGLGRFSNIKTISTNSPQVRLAETADLNGDLLPDVIAATDGDTRLSWYSNLGGGNFGFKNTIHESGRFDATKAIAVADYDNDGDMDIVATNNNFTIWFTNDDGLGEFSDALDFPFSDVPEHVFAADVNLDGNIDVITDTADGEGPSWFNNTDGQGGFSEAIVIGNIEATISTVTGDVDNDGDKDIVRYLWGDNAEWYENLFEKPSIKATVYLSLIHI